MIDMYKWVNGYDPYRRTPDNYYDELKSDEELAEEEADITEFKKEERKDETAAERYARSTADIF